MSVTLGSNIASFIAQRMLGQATRAVSSTSERLSSGLRINRASDDAAGLAIADSLNADSRVFSQGVRNINDGVSALNIADSALNELTSILIRQRELATQAANGTFSFQQRKALTTEANALVDEFNRIVEAADFNGLKLYDQSLGEFRIQAGYGELNSLGFDLGGGLSTTVGDGTFDPGVQYGAGNNSFWIESGDLNGDGTVDVVSGDYNDDTISIYFGNGDGTLQARVTLATSDGPNINMEDINNDGALDLVSRGWLDSTVRSYLNDGTGNFTLASSFTSSINGATRLADVNGDGFSDFVEAGNATVSVFLGNGDGTFDSVITSASLSTSQDLELADFDHDGNLDLVRSYSSNFGVQLGNGDGTFGAISTYLVQSGGLPAAYYLDLGDFDGDGEHDVAVSVFSATGNDNVSILLGNGDGTFQSSYQAFSTTGTINEGIGVTDLNGDGFDDIVALSRTQQAAYVSLGNGDGTFSAYSTYSTGGAVSP